MSQLKEMLGKGSNIEFGGRTWYVCPLTFNDLCDLEDRFGDVGSIDLARASTQRYLLWLALRSEEGSQERFENEFSVGELLGLGDPKKTAEFVSEVFKLCGLIKGEDSQESADEKKPEAKASQRRVKRSTESSAD